MIILLLLSPPSFLLASCENNPPIVTTPLGKIRGYYNPSFTKKTYASFEGIPYAKPPIGQRRFQEPAPIEKWDGIWDATHLLSCAQAHYTMKDTIISGTEDCLYLNIYVPRKHINVSDNLDVIVHIHGGAFMIGNGHFYAFPGYLMDKDVIFVTFNYRLGILGFLSTEDDVLPGNNGLKDQVMALKWIKNNIEYFGGNPDSVTINGASAGGASVHLHYFSPMSQELFRRGFSQSGTALNPWVFQKEAGLKTKILASAVGCPQSPSDDLVKCLKQRNVNEILKHIDQFYAFKYLPLSPFGPVVEKSGLRPFLDQHPYHLLVSKQVLDVPWMASFVAHEGGGLVNEFGNAEELNKIWTELAPFLLHYNYTAPKAEWENIGNKFLDFYLGKNKKISQDNFEKFIKAVSDRIAIDGTAKAVSLQSKAAKASVYLYELEYTGDSKKRIEHGDDNQYFYYNVSAKYLTENELRMKDIMVDMLLSYVKNGKPVINGTSWTPVQNGDVTFLKISSPDVFELVNDNNLGNGEFWNSLNLSENQNTSDIMLS